MSRIAKGQSFRRWDRTGDSEPVTLRVLPHFLQNSKSSGCSDRQKWQNTEPRLPGSLRRCGLSMPAYLGGLCLIRKPSLPSEHKMEAWRSRKMKTAGKASTEWPSDLTVMPIPLSESRTNSKGRAPRYPQARVARIKRVPADHWRRQRSDSDATARNKALLLGDPAVFRCRGTRG